MADRKLKIALAVGLIGLILVLAGLAFVLAGGTGEVMEQPTETAAQPTENTTGSTPEESTDPTTQATDPENTTETTEEPTEESTEAPTEPGPERFTLTFVGDCTLGSAENGYYNTASFVGTVGEDYDYPFDNVRRYFEEDDFTMVNLETVLADTATPEGGKIFVFRGPTAYTRILTGSSVEAVTLANNHTMDHGKTGFQATKDALDAAEVTYVEPDGSALYTTESGLTIGLYAVNFTLDKKDMKQEIAALRKAGAEIVVVAFHWGIEGSYRANPEQIQNAHDCIDAGADIVYGHHPHVLQRIEEYNGGIIYYSLGNFSFGGNTFPRDTDSVILRQEIIREVDGSVRLGEMELIPVSISSMVGQNNYQPIPLEPGTEAYDRVLSKLDGSFTGPDLNVDYSDIQEPTEEPTEDAGGDATQPPADVPTDPPAEPPVETPTEAPTEAPTQPPADPPAESPAPDGEA